MDLYGDRKDSPFVRAYIVIILSCINCPHGSFSQSVTGYLDDRFSPKYMSLSTSNQDSLVDNMSSPMIHSKK